MVARESPTNDGTRLASACLLLTHPVDPARPVLLSIKHRAACAANFPAEKRGVLAQAVLWR